MGSWDEDLDCGCCWQVLMATGRKPKTQNIGLEDVGAEIDEKGGLKVTTCIATQTCANLFPASISCTRSIDCKS